MMSRLYLAVRAARRRPDGDRGVSRLESDGRQRGPDRAEIGARQPGLVPSGRTDGFRHFTGGK